MRKFTKFNDNKNKEFTKFKKFLKWQEYLFKKGLINKNDNTFQKFKIKPVSQTKNKFNEEYFNDKNRIVERNQMNELLEKNNWGNKRRKEFTEKYWNVKLNIDETLVELLLRDSQTLEISYQEFEVDITAKGLKYLNDNWLKNNWK